MAWSTPARNSSTRSGNPRNRKRVASLGPAEVLLPEVQARFDALRAWRRDRAAEQRVPPYVIFQDRTLAEIARAEPSSLEALGRISGVGQSKLDRYGKAVLALLEEAV